MAVRCSVREIHNNTSSDYTRPASHTSTAHKTSRNRTHVLSSASHVLASDQRLPRWVVVGIALVVVDRIVGGAVETEDNLAHEADMYWDSCTLADSRRLVAVMRRTSS
jgi:hypothetical protein